VSIRILVVDDSAFARKVVREMLAGSAEIEVVGTARDGEEAIELVQTLNPDVVLCDLQMPKLDGVGFIRRQMQERPLPIVVLSAAREDAIEVIEALESGAIDVLKKPTALASDELRSIRDELIEKLKAAVGAPTENLAPAREAVRSVSAPSTSASKERVVVIAVSTGGPQALRSLLPAFPANFPVPIAIVLHMPVGYTSLFAEKLNEVCALTVKEAEEGDPVVAGQALLAPAGRHLLLQRTGPGAVMAKLSMQPLEKIHRPSADVLFKSAAEAYQDGVVAVVMTGMGSDGKEGAAWVKAAGGTVVTQDEKSCVIYGMPRSVAEAGLSDAEAGLGSLAQCISSNL
jgi:two-component system chemotaxis response regulator CheB